MTFEGKLSILRDSGVDLLIGLDFLKRFQCEVSLKENVLKLTLKNRVLKIPFEKEKNFEILNEEEMNTYVHCDDESVYEYDDK
jgi:hypothetical protein